MVDGDREHRRPWSIVPEKDRRHYRAFGLTETAPGPPDPVVELHTEPPPAAPRPGGGLIDWLRKVAGR